jgi:hypothetical protein
LTCSSEREDESDGPDPEDQLTPEELAQLEEERRAAERSYFNVTRSWSAGLLFALPLLAVYELGVLMFRSEINAAADIIKMPISWLRENPVQIFGADLMLVVGIVLIAVALAAVWRVGRLGALHAGTFLGMFSESLLYAMILGPLALAPITGELKFGGFSPHLDELPLKLVVAAGAGFYEEAFFRFIILGAVFYLAKEVGKLRPFTAGALALVVSGACFSAAHFLGGAETPELGTFIYRLAAGMILGLVFLTRGFGVAAWTHAIYDLYILCLAAG